MAKESCALFAKIAPWAIEENGVRADNAPSLPIPFVSTLHRHIKISLVKVSTNVANSSANSRIKPLNYLAGALLGLVLAWAYADPMLGLWNRWWTDPAYGHGFFVPVFALFLLWYRRNYFPAKPQGSWSGWLFIGAAIVTKILAEYLYYAMIDAVTIVPMITGIGLLLLGWQGMRWFGPSALFLTFMVPLPGIVADVLSHPLQRSATIASTYIIQLTGIPAVAEGNVIVLTHAKIGVIEACNGLRMLILFIAVATAIAILVKRPWWCRGLILLSAIPVALLANVIRILTTALAYEYASSEWAGWWFHGLAAWLMMPFGILLLYLELVYLDHAFPEKETPRPLSAA